MEDWKTKLASLQGLDPGSDAAPEGKPAPAKKAVKVRYKMAYEKRRGKPCTILYGFEGLDDAGIDELCSKLKKKLGIGGSSRGGEILLQGDVREKVKPLI